MMDNTHNPFEAHDEQPSSLGQGGDSTAVTPASASGPNWSLWDSSDDQEQAAPFSAPPKDYEATSPSNERDIPNSRKALTLIGVVAVAAALVLGAAIGHSLWPTEHGNDASSLSPSSGDSGQTFNPFGGSTGSSGSSNDTGASGTSGDANAQSGEGAASSGAVSAVAKAISPGLVDVNTTIGLQQAAAAGTGIVLTSNGYILTNNHVIDGATSVTVTDIGDGKTYTADIVGYDRSKDVAVLEAVGASNLTVDPIGNSSYASVGESIVGVGNAGGVGGTPSHAAGSITALDQSITATDENGSNGETLAGLIQTNAPIQPGDSGGPLVNMQGKIIGMDTAASTSFQFSTGSAQGFSIPIDEALSLAHKIVTNQSSDTIHIGQTGFIGVEVSPSSSTGSSAGLSVLGSVSGSPAAQAGIGNGSTILSVNGINVNQGGDLTNLMVRYHPGTKITVVWTDSSNGRHTSVLTLEKGPAL
jgi:S1-C subfamily serine protease